VLEADERVGGGVGDWPFVVRDEELGVLLAAVERGAREPDRPSGVVLVAPAGVGKTRLLTEASDWARAHGHDVAKVIGTRATAGTPFAALASLAPRSSGSAHPSEAALYAGYASEVRGNAGRRVLAVDDAHLLDPGSAALMLQLAMTGTATVLVAVRRGEPTPDPVTTLWKDGLAARLDLQQFSREEAAALLARALGGHVERRTARLLAGVSGGNALYLREVVLAALADGSLREDGGTWAWDGTVALPPRLRDVIGERLAGRSAAEREALVLLALGEPVTVPVAEQLAGVATLAELERAGLVRAGGSDGEPSCRLAHPLYGEAVLDSVGPIARRRLLRRVADAVSSYGMRSDQNALRVATWRVDAGDDVPSSELLVAAELASRAFDHRLAERLARLAAERGGGAAGAVALSHALNGQRRFAEAEQVLAGAEEPVLLGCPHDAVLHRRYLDRRFYALFEGLGRSEGAAAMLDRFAAGHEEADPAHRDAARQMAAGLQAKLLLDRGELSEAVATVTPVLDAATPEPEGLLNALETAGEATAYLGDTDSARTLHARMHDLAATGRPEVARAAATAPLQEMLCQVLEGRASDLLPVVGGFYEQLIASPDALARGLTAMMLGSVHLLRGTVRAARESLADAVQAFRAAEIADHLPWALAHRCQAEALAGDLLAARSSQAESRSGRRRARTARAECDFVLADALVQMAAGDLTGAAQTCLAGADELAQLRLHTARLLHVAVRLGAPPGRAAGRLEKIATEVECALARLRADHVNALVAHDGQALDVVTGRFEVLGMWLVAAEAAAHAAAAHDRAGHWQESARSAARSRGLAGRCEGANVPMLAEVAAPAPELTRREREVAALAADGLSNAAIAERLVLSPRTVESHVYACFAKLGVARREGLREALEGRPHVVGGKFSSRY
jgi:DNA-binding NarL/FixJ family response regulator